MLEGYESLNVGQKNTFRDICNKLISYNFLARDKTDNKESYYFVISFKNLFDDFFEILGYTVEIDQAVGTIMLNNSNSVNQLRLSRDQTVVLLILRLLYSENMKETTVNSNVVINVEEIQNKYKYLEIKNKINKTDLVRSLRLFRKYNLIEVVGLTDSLISNTKVVLLPTLLSAIKVSDLNEVHKNISYVLSEERE